MEILMSAVNGRTDRDDINLQELVFAGKLKLALAHIEKRLKKGKHDALLVNRALVLLAMSDSPDRQRQGQKELLELVQRKPPIRDPETLELLDAALDRHGASDEIMGMWERAVAADPSNAVSLAGAWFERKFLAGDWKSAKKAALIASRHSPDKRRFLFSQVICHHLYSSTTPQDTMEESSKDRDLSRTIAYRLLSKALADTPRDEGLPEGMSKPDTTAARTRFKGQVNPLSPTIQTSSDIEFLVKVYTDQGKDKEILAVFEDDARTGLGSITGNGVWELVRCKIELLIKCERWQDLYSLCITLISDAKAELLDISTQERKMKFGALGDDWLVWKALIRATSKVRTDLNVSQAHRAIEAFKEINPRHHYLSSLEWQLHSLPSRAGPDEDILGLGPGLLANFLTKPSAFRDVSSFVQALPGPDRTAFVHQVAKAVTSLVGEVPQKTDSGSKSKRERQWVYAEINSLKIDYTVGLIRQQGPENAELTEAFVANCLRLWVLSLTFDEDNHTITDRRCGDDAAILAATGCIHLYHEQRRTALLRATCILEELLFYSPHNYEAQLLLIQVYIYQGAVTKAFRHYARLDIKNLQHLSLSWLLFTRISTLHPLPSAIHGIVVGEELRSILKSIERVEESVTSSLLRYLNAGTYRNLLGQLEVKKFCQGSAAKLLLLMEHWRVAWVGGTDFPESLPADTIHADQWIFTRDTLGFPNYESKGQPSIERLICAGPPPETSWIELQMLVGHLRWSFAGSNGPSLECTQEFFEEGKLPLLVQQMALEAGIEPSHLDHTTAERNIRRLISDTFSVMAECLALDRALSRSDPATKSSKKEAKSEGKLVKSKETILSTVESSLGALTRSHQDLFLSERLMSWVGENSNRPFEIMQWTFYHNIHLQIEAMSLITMFLELLALMDKRKQWHIWGEGGMNRKATEVRQKMESNLKLYSDRAENLLTRFNAPNMTKELVDHVLAADDKERDDVARELGRVIDCDRLRSICMELKESWTSGLECIAKTAVARA